jgi:Quinohemoprotein amine dehydrogenase, alpha subunit domain III
LFTSATRFALARALKCGLHRRLQVWTGTAALTASLVLLPAINAFAATFSLQPMSIDFGAQQVATTSTTRTVTLNNKAKTTLQISLTVTGDFVVQNSCPSVIAAGATCTFTVRFSPAALGNRAGSLTVSEASKLNNKDTVKLSGIGVAATTLTPASLAFGNVATNTTSPGQIATLTNNQDTTLTGIVATTTNPDYAVSGCPSTLAARTACTLTVTFTPTESAGTTENATLTVTHSAITSPQTVSLTGRSVVPFSLSASTITFPSTFQGQTSASQLTLTNNQSATLNPVTLSTAAPFSATGCSSPVPGGGTCAITVNFSPVLAHVGSINGSLTVQSPVPAQTSNVSLAGVALRPVTISPTSLDFLGVTVASTSAASTVTVTNNQPTALTFGAPLAGFTGAAASNYSIASTTCGTTLAGGASCNISVVLTPSVGGSRPATMGINTNAFGSPHQVTLAGIGTTPLTITPSNVSFGSTDVGLASAPQEVTIRNNQSVAVNSLALSVTGDFARDIVGTTCGATLAATQSCIVSLRMTPTIAGLRTGSLVITSDTTESPNTVALNGSGTNGVTASVTSLTFAPQTVNTTSGAQQVVLTNHQVVPAAIGTIVTGDFAATDACGGTIPASSTCAVSITFTPTALGTRTGTATFNNPGSPATVVSLTGVGASESPAAAVASVTPGTGTIGTTVLGVVVIGNGYANFAPTSTVSFGSDIIVSNLRNVSANSLTVDISIDATATPGARTVTVTTPLAGGGTETASLAAGFVVSASANLPLASITPDRGAQAQTLDVAIVGTDTHFRAGTTFANFGDGISIDALVVHDPTHATATVSVSPTTTLGWRTVTLVTGGEQATIAPVDPSGPGFLVIAGNAAIQSVSPNSGAQGAAPFVVSLTGTNTHFLQGATAVSFGSGINVGNIQVLDATHLTVSIAVTAGATIGLRDVIATTGGEVATLIGAFTVTAAAPPALSDVTPSSGQQGQTLLLTLVGANTHFTTDTPPPSLTLGSNITVAPLTIVDDTTITASIDIDFLAQTGSRQGTLSSGGTNFPFSFVVQPSAASIATVSPASGPQGGVVSVTVTGQATHWQQGTTSASFAPYQPGCPVVAVNTVTVETPTRAVLNLTIPVNTCVGSQAFQMATGGEVVSSSFGVYEHTPSLNLGPSSAMVGTIVTVNFLGEFTHFGASTSAVIDGTGITLQNFQVTSAASAAATLVVSANAPAGGRTVTLTTSLGAGAFEVVTSPFSVATTPAVLTSIAPFHASRGETTTVTIDGTFTHFSSPTIVSFGPDIVAGPPTIVSPTRLTVGVSIGAGAALGWRSAFVNTGSEQLAIGFRVDGPAAPAISSVSPTSGAQGQSLSVGITGVNTSFNQTSQLILGAGVTVADFKVTSPTTATASVSVSATAPIGPNTVIVLTQTGPGQQEIASGAGFTVVRGPSQILSVTPNVAAQSQVLNVSIVGQGTHWLQGGTIADFGSGITVAQLTIVDPTHATAQIVVGSGAPLGFHAVTLITDGEYASIAQGLDVQQGTPALLSSTPNAGSQGTTFTIQVLGSLTHWVQGQTTASYGAGVTVNSFTVIDSVSGVIGVTIDPLAFVDVSGCHALTVTTGTEQVTLPNQLCVQAGAAVLTTVSPNAAPQGSTLTVQVTGQNTHFTAGLTTATFGGGINTSNVTVTSPTTASVDLAVSTQAASGFRTATLTTLGESASLALAFNVGPNTPTLNSAAPFSGQPGQSLTVRLLGQYTHWVQGGTTVTFGEGITVNNVTVVDASTADADIVSAPLAPLGGRAVTVTTGGEIVTASVFTVVSGAAIISQVAPQSGNQGQEIVLNIAGQNTHWQQGFTQFAIAGAGGDITVNYVLINNETTATVGISVAPTAAPGTRSIYMVTGTEALVGANAFVVTGGVPAIAYVSPGSAKAGDTGVNVQIAGLYTTWLNGTTTVDFGPGITVSQAIVNSDTSITAVIGIDAAAGLGSRTVVVRNATSSGTQALAGFFTVVSPQPPPPFVQYETPTAGLRGQTFTINISGANTHFDPTPNATSIDFGDPGTSGIQINSFQVTSPTSARVNVTIATNAVIGARTVSILTHTATGDEMVQTSFSVVQATPVMTIVDPSSGMQGATVTVNLVGQYTGFNQSTVFNFGPGITIDESQVLGANIAQVKVTIAQLATLGTRFVTATTGTEVVTATFSVSPSTAVIVAVAPNTARQGDSASVGVTGQNTHWDSSTMFTFGSGIVVTNAVVDSATHATVNVSVAALASLGAHSLVATTLGEVAALVNAFVVQPGTPLILSSSPSSGAQQANITLTVLGQATAWDATTTVDLGAAITVLSVQPTSATSLTVRAVVDPFAALGSRSLTITTGAQVLTLANALLVTSGPAAISSLSPSQAGQGETLDVNIVGVNTHFVSGITAVSFGNNIAVNGVVVLSPTAATANITIGAGASVGLRSVFAVTYGETAAIVNGFNVLQTTPVIQFVTPASAAQGATLDLAVVGTLTNFTAATTFDFGAGVGVNSVTPLSATNATVNVSISPVAARTTRNVSATTNGVTATGTNLFTVSSGPAYISAVSPAQGQLGQVGLQVTISGFATHFTAGTPTVSLGSGVTVTQIIVDSDTQLRATVNIDPLAPVQANNVVVTTLGEVATLVGGFTVQRPFVSSVSPTSAYQEQTLDVVVTGVNTHFTNGVTTASFGAGVSINQVTVTSATQATVNITVQLSAVPGARTVTMTTGLESASGTALFTVLAKETPVITWPTPADIVYGTPLGAAQLNAQANVPGTFVYTPAAGTVLPAGQAQPLSVAFTPDNTIRYFNVNATVFINVAKAPQSTLVVTGAPVSAVFNTSFTVSTSGGSSTSAVTFTVSGVCSNVAGGGLVTMTSGTGSCSITATKAGDSNYFDVTSAAVLVGADKATQSTLVVTGAPATATTGTQFTVSTTGGNSTAAATFSTTGACSNVGAVVTMTSNVGTCSITATKAADTNYLEAVSAPVSVGASGPVPPTFDIVSSSAFLSVPTTGSPTPGILNVRLQANGVSVAAPAGGIAVTGSSDNTACVTVGNGTIDAGAYVGTLTVNYGSATLPCTATITATTATYGNDAVTVAVYAYQNAPVTSAATAISYFNPAPLPNPIGQVVSSVASVSYYNPAPIPNPSGSVRTSVAAVSYFNPASIPDPSGAVATSVAAVSYFNPAPIPNPSGSVATAAAAVSYFNPAPVPSAGGVVSTNTAAVSYCNPDGTCAPTAPQQQIASAPANAAAAAAAADPNVATSTFAISVANGPTATLVRPVLLPRGDGARYTLVIDGANLNEAVAVTLVGVEQYVVVSPPVVRADGRRVTVDVLISANTPFAVVPVIVSGTGWNTPDVPGMRVEIVP